MLRDRLNSWKCPTKNFQQLFSGEATSISFEILSMRELHKVRFESVDELLCPQRVVAELRGIGRLQCPNRLKCSVAIGKRC